MNIQVRTILLGLLSIGFVQSYAQTFALQVKNDQITYLNDDRGNRILDFSTCGYKSSEQDIPSVRNVVFVPWKAGDNTARIQRAIYYVASLTPDASGFRGAVLLDQGEFSLSGSIRISTSGIVLRGTDKEKTILLKKGSRQRCAYLHGRSGRPECARHIEGAFPLCSGKRENIGSRFGCFSEKRRPRHGYPSFRQRMDCLFGL